MRRRTGGLLTVITLLAWISSPVFGLGVGDQAPPLMIQEWVKGEPVDLSTNSSRVHLVEFWATWCPPCKASVPLLTELQKKYARDLVIIGVTDPDDRGNTETAIRRFVKQQGDGMSYHVAIDRNAATKNAYMTAAGVAGIPHAFLVGRDGRIVWQGSPLDPVLGEVIPKVIDGTYDLSSARVEAEVLRRFQALSYPIQLEQWGTVWEGLVEILKLDPGNDVALDALVNIYAKELRNTRTFRSWAEGHLEAHRTNVVAMERLSRALLSINDLSARMPDLALKAARSAYDASNQQRAQSIAIYAQAMYQIGLLDRAITLQQAAVAAASESDRRDFARMLDYYERCKTLGDTVN